MFNRNTLGVYELNDIALLKDVFIWAYERSAARYAADAGAAFPQVPLELVVARALARLEGPGRARLLVAAQPTRGLDVGAIETVHAYLRAAAAKGVAHISIETLYDAKAHFSK